MRLITLAALVLLVACSPPRESMIEEALAAVPGTSAGLTSDPACLPGDDGIGGTGCEVN
ncbi:hypothetical protein MCELHM10_01915 [Paracoccaceae bacterium]|jgi:hypothetical protein